MKINLKKILLLVTGLIAINFLANFINLRLDLTSDHRYSLNKASKQIVSNIKDYVTIKVYLKGNFPSEFKRLQMETQRFLEELAQENHYIRYKFVNPKNIKDALIKKGLTPSELQINEDGKLSEIVIFPWATVQYKNKSAKVNLLKDSFSNNQNAQIENSIQNLEYGFANALEQITVPKHKKIAILKGNGELQDFRLISFLKQLKKQYLLAPFTLDSVAERPQITTDELQKYSLIIIAKPTKKFTEKEKYCLDQYITHGGKSLWLVSSVQADLDSLVKTGASLAYPKDINLTDFFFNYGIRINYNLISDLYSSKIPLATGKVGNQIQYQLFNWNYYPIALSNNNHPINNRLNPVQLKFPSSIDTLKNQYKKTILISSSKLSKTEGTPKLVELKEVVKKPNLSSYKKGKFNIGVLIEGKFKSVYNNRIKPFSYKNNLNQGNNNKMIVIADGNFIANEFKNNTPVPLGFDRYNQLTYDNSNFLLNAVNYLMDDQGLINLRTKKLKVAFLNKQKAYLEATKWKIINVLFPLLILFVLALIANYFRKKTV